MKILVIGYGQIAEEFARLNPQFQILGIRRQNTSQLSNVEIINEDYSSGISITAQKFDPDWIIYFPKIKNSGLSEYENGYLKQLNNLYDFFPSAKKIFISSTKVFSGYANLEVDESSPAKAADAQGNVIVKYEQIIQNHEDSFLLRLSGLITQSSNFVKLVVNKKLFSSNKYINAIHLDDVVSIISGIVNEHISAKLINCVMPYSKKYSDLFVDFSGEPVNAEIKSIKYNKTSNFKFKSVEKLL